MMLVSVSYFFASSPKVFVGYGNTYGVSSFYVRDTKLAKKIKLPQIIVLFEY